MAGTKDADEMTYVIVWPDDRVERWSTARFKRLWSGALALPQIAGNRLRYAAVYNEPEPGETVKPQCILMYLDYDGRHNLLKEQASRKRLQEAGGTSAEFNAITHWRPTAELRAAIMDAAIKG